MLDLGVTEANIYHLDLSGSDESRAALQAALQGCEALVICTSAVPEVAVLSTLLGGLRFWAGSKLSGLLGRQQPAEQLAGEHMAEKLHTDDSACIGLACSIKDACYTVGKLASEQLSRLACGVRTSRTCARRHKHLQQLERTATCYFC
jgi:hypothetical protein